MGKKVKLGLGKRTKKLAGLDIGTFSLKLAILESDKMGNLTVKNIRKKLLTPGQIVDKEIRDHEGIVYAIQSFVDEVDPKLSEVCIAVAGRKILVDRLVIPEPTGKGKRDVLLKQAITLEAEQRIPTGIDSVQLDFVELGSDGKNVSVLLVAARNDIVDDYVGVVVEAGLIPTIVDLEAIAAYNIFEYNYEIGPQTNIAIADIGHNVTNVVFIIGGNLFSIRDIGTAAKNVWGRFQSELRISTDELKRYMKSEAVPENSPATKKAIYNSIEELSAGLGMAFSYIENAPGGGSIDRLFISGGAVMIPFLAESLASRLGIPCEIIDPLKKISYEPEAYEDLSTVERRATYAVALGLAIRGGEA